MRHDEKVLASETLKNCIHRLCKLDFAGTFIHLALLLPMTGSSARGPTTAGAAELAVKTINADTTLLPNCTLEYSQLDSGCSAKQALAAMGELLQGDSHIDAVIGPGCSSACEVTSYFSGGQEIPQISHSCTSPSLSNKAEYNLVRTVGLRLRISCF